MCNNNITSDNSTHTPPPTPLPLNGKGRSRKNSFNTDFSPSTESTEPLKSQRLKPSYNNRVDQRHTQSSTHFQTLHDHNAPLENNKNTAQILLAAMLKRRKLERIGKDPKNETPNNPLLLSPVSNNEFIAEAQKRADSIINNASRTIDIHPQTREAAISQSLAEILIAFIHHNKNKIPTVLFQETLKKFQGLKEYLLSSDREKVLIELVANNATASCRVLCHGTNHYKHSHYALTKEMLNDLSAACKGLSPTITRQIRSRLEDRFPPILKQSMHPHLQEQKALFRPKGFMGVLHSVGRVFTGLFEIILKCLGVSHSQLPNKEDSEKYKMGGAWSL